VDQLVELERVDLTAVQSREPVAYVLEQREQLLLVIVGDERSRLATSGAFLLAASVLTSVGFYGAERARDVPAERRYTPAPLTSISYAEHDLQLASIVLHIARDAAGDGEEALIGQMPFRWLGPRTGRIEIDGDGEVERAPAARLAPGTRLYPAGSRTGYLEPDATLRGGSGEDVFAVLIEYDRTERPHKQIDRLRRYERWLLDGWRGGPFAPHAIPLAVIFLTAREGPLSRLIETADETFSAWYADEHAGPREGTHPARERVLFCSRGHVLAGDWMMRWTPSLPRAFREEPAVCRPRSRLAERDRLVLLTLGMTGLRRSELIALDWGDVTLDGPRPSLLVRRGKGGKPRRQPLPSQLAAALERRRSQHCASVSDPVFEYLGHSDLSTVSRYAHVASEELYVAAQALADGPDQLPLPHRPAELRRRRRTDPSRPARRIGGCARTRALLKIAARRGSLPEGFSGRPRRAIP
jgi:Phage integrase family